MEWNSEDDIGQLEDEAQLQDMVKLTSHWLLILQFVVAS